MTVEELEYFAGDERAYWEPTVSVNGATEDMSSGFTFEVKIAEKRTSAAVVTKVAGITGGPAGVVTVAWSAGELALTPGRYVAQLRAIRGSDSKDWTVEVPLVIKRRIA